MKKTLMMVALALMLVPVTAFSQNRGNKGSVPVFEEATAREAYPNVAVFVFPQICDLEMLSNERVSFQPVGYPLAKDLNSMSEAELQNNKTRALQNACQLAGADLIIEPLYTSTVYDGDTKTLYISVSGYPAKYINFRSLQPTDLEMIKVLYPGGVERIQQQNEGRVVTTATEGSK